MISIDNVSAGYTKESIIDNISVSIGSGELVGILGANGSGKSTLAKAICNILPHSGNVRIDEQVIENLKTSQVAGLINYIPQHSGISIDISVLDVVMMGFNPSLKLFERPSKAMEEQARKVIGLVGLADRIDTNYMLLSEGQKQLAVLARALVNDGKLIVMDEPESALDFNVRYRMMQIIKEWIDEGDRAGVIILHDTMLALNNCDRLILLKDRKIADIVDLHKDAIEVIETKLQKIYGEISLAKVSGKNKKDNIIMMFDAEGV